MEEFHLSGILAADELYVVHKQKIQLAVLIAQLLTGVGLYGVDNVVGEILAGDKQYVVFRVLHMHVVAYRMQQMRFAQSHAAIDEKRVVRVGGVLRNGKRGRVRKAVGLARDEGLERIPVQQVAAVAALTRLHGLCGRAGAAVLAGKHKADRQVQLVRGVNAVGYGLGIEIAQGVEVKLVVHHQHKGVALNGNGLDILYPCIVTYGRHLLF